MRPRLRPEKRPDRDKRQIRQRIVAQTGSARRVIIILRAGLGRKNFQKKLLTTKKNHTDFLDETHLSNFPVVNTRIKRNYDRPN
jgi:hypothetical protein